MIPRPRPPRASRWVARALFYGFFGALVLTAVFVVTEVKSERLRARVEGRLNEMLNRKVRVGEAYFRLLGSVRLTNVIVENAPGYRSPYLLSAPEVRVDFTLFPRAGEPVGIEGLRLERPVMYFERIRDGEWNTHALWREEAPETAPRPPFQVAIEVEDAVVHYDDGNIGDTGIRTQFRGVRGSYLVSRDATGVRSRGIVHEAQLEGGGTASAVLTATPDTWVDLTFDVRGVSVDRAKPYFHWLDKTLYAASGRADMKGVLHFRPDTSRSGFWMKGEGRFRGVSLTARTTGRRRVDQSGSFSFVADIYPESAYVHAADVRLHGSRIHASGSVSTRRADTEWALLDFRADPIRGEDVRFLLDDPQLEVVGELRGTYRYVKRGKRQSYEIAGDASQASASYGPWIEKEKGRPARVEIEGDFGALPRRVAIDLEPSRLIVYPNPKGARIVVPAIRAPDLREHIPPYRDRVSKRLSIEGWFTADFRVEGDRQWGRWDFTDAQAWMGGLKKPWGMPARAEVVLLTQGDAVLFEKLRLDVGTSFMDVIGVVGAEASHLTMRGEAAVEDLRRILPHGAADTFLDAAAGRVAYDLQYDQGTNEEELRRSYLPSYIVGAGDRRDTEYIRGRIDLAKTALEWGLFRKKEGVPLAFSGPLYPEFHGGTFDVGGSQIRVRLLGRDVDIVTDDLPADLLLQLLHLARGLDPDKITFRGPLALRVRMTYGGDLIPFLLTSDLTDAAVGYEGLLKKPRGVPFRIVARGKRGESRVMFDEAAITLGNSRFVLTGTTGTVLRASLDLDVESDIHAEDLTRYVPVLYEMKTAGRPLAEILRAHADPEGRIQVNFHASGTIGRPEAVVETAAALGEAFQNALKKLFSGGA